MLVFFHACCKIIGSNIVSYMFPMVLHIHIISTDPPYLHIDEGDAELLGLCESELPYNPI